jgi:hypothetical protein
MQSIAICQLSASACYPAGPLAGRRPRGLHCCGRAITSIGASCAVRHEYDRDRRRASGVEIIDAENNLTYRYQGRIVFLDASALNPARVLRNPATDIRLR